MPSLRVEQHGCSPQGSNTVKAEHGGKLQRRHQTSPGWGLQQAGSSHAARPLFFFGGWWGGIPAPYYSLYHPAWLPFSYRHSPGSGTAGAVNLEAPFKVRRREQGCSPGWETRLTANFNARAGGRVRQRGVLTLLQSVEQIFAPNNEFTDRHKKIEES